MFYAERPGIYTVKKGSAQIENLELNTAALKELGCDYILSALRIENEAANQLKLLNDTGFDTQNSYYEIYVYKIVN